jgi:hypothetical protein
MWQLPFIREWHLSAESRRTNQYLGSGFWRYFVCIAAQRGLASASAAVVKERKLMI